MSKKIIGITVGTQLPKPNFKQTDPTKGDYIKNKPDFEGLRADVDEYKVTSEEAISKLNNLVGDTPVADQIENAFSQKDLGDVIRYDTPQILDRTQKNLTRNNTGSVGFDDIYKTETTFNFTWDGNTEGRDSITIGNFIYYKVSDSAPEVESLSSVTSKMANTGIDNMYYDNEYIYHNNNDFVEYFNCYMAGYSMVIQQAGECYVIYEDGIYRFTAPSAGIYFLYSNGDNVNTYQESLSLTAIDTITLTYTWDGDTAGRDSFIHNAWYYYKVSDDVFSYGAISGVMSKGRASGTTVSQYYNGVNCYKVGDAIIVTKSGLCELAAGNSTSLAIEFTASAGIYFCSYRPTYGDAGDSYATELKLLINGKHGIYLNSEANNSFTIGVTDNGTITTEDESGAITKMIASPESAEVGQVLSVKSIDANGNITWETINPEAAEGSITTDPTLSIEGSAADAKVVGEAISDIETAIGNLESNVNTKVPTTRTINGKALSSNVTLTPKDIGAADATETNNAISNLNTLIGDKSVSEQIAVAVEEAVEEALVEVYVQDDVPENAPDGSIWVDLDADGAPTTSGKTTANVYVIDARTNDMTTVDFSQYKINDVIVVTVS